MILLFIVFESEIVEKKINTTKMVLLSTFRRNTLFLIYNIYDIQ